MSHHHSRGNIPTTRLLPRAQLEVNRKQEISWAPNTVHSSRMRWAGLTFKKRAVPAMQVADKRVKDLQRLFWIMPARRSRRWLARAPGWSSWVLVTINSYIIQCFKVKFPFNIAIRIVYLFCQNYSLTLANNSSTILSSGAFLRGLPFSNTAWPFATGYTKVNTPSLTRSINKHIPWLLQKLGARTPSRRS